MDFAHIFKKWEELWFTKEVKKRQINYFSEFKNSQFFRWLNSDKRGLKHLMELEKQVEKESKYFIWKNISHPLSDYSVTSYFVNFQYFVEFINIHGRKIKLLKDMRVYANDWWEDLYVSLRLSLMWHYKTSFFHLRSFMENYFMMIWEHSLRYWKIDTEWKGFKWTKNKIKPKFRYLTSNEKNKQLFRNNINLDYLFDWEEFCKIYDYLSKITHNRTKIKTNYSETISFDEDLLDKYLMLSWLVMLLTIRLVYGFLEKDIKQQWMKTIEKPVPWTRNDYRYIIWEMIFGDMFYDLYENKKSRDFFKNEVWIDAERLYPKLKETIKDHDMYNSLRKKAGWDHDKFIQLVYERRTKHFS